jgi:hypothetical protein
MRVNSKRDADRRLLPGMKATARVEVAPAQRLLLLPVSAVASGKVWVVGKDGAESERSVVTGRTDGKMIEIVKGLRKGDRVLTQAKP